MCYYGKKVNILEYQFVTVYFQYCVSLFHRHINACIRGGKQAGMLICDCVFVGAWIEHQHSVLNGPSATPRV